MSSPIALSLGIALVLVSGLAHAQPSGGAPAQAPAEAAGQPSVEVPSDLAAPPKHASKTRSGLAYVMLGKGQGK
jgi:hypothetical protein